MSLVRNLILRKAKTHLPFCSVTTSTNVPCPLTVRPSRAHGVTQALGHEQNSTRFYFALSPQLYQGENSTKSFWSSVKSQPFSKDTLLITEVAKKRLGKIISSGEPGTYLRVSVEGGGCSGFQYKFEIDSKPVDNSDDIVLACDDGTKETSVAVVIDKSSVELLKGATIDYEVELIRTAFRIVDIPLAAEGCSCGASFNVKID